MNVDDMKLEEFARVLCLTEFFSPRRAEVLARLRIESTRFDAANARHTRQLEGATKADDVETLQRFGSAYASTMAECREGRTTLESLGPAPELATPALLPTDETGMMPPTEEIRRLIREAEPRVAIPKGAHAQSTAPGSQHVASPEEEGGDTAMMPPPEEVRRMIREAEPARAMASAPSAGSRTPTLSLEQYAVIRATVRVRPAEADGAWARFGVQPSERSAVEAAMLRQIAATPEATREFNARLEHFVGYLANTRAPVTSPTGRRNG